LRMGRRPGWCLIIEDSRMAQANIWPLAGTLITGSHSQGSLRKAE
jgi:hypothetical protein